MNIYFLHVELIINCEKIDLFMNLFFEHILYNIILLWKKCIIFNNIFIENSIIIYDSKNCIEIFFEYYLCFKNNVIV